MLSEHCFPYVLIDLFQNVNLIQTFCLPTIFTLIIVHRNYTGISHNALPRRLEAFEDTKKTFYFPLRVFVVFALP